MEDHVRRIITIAIMVAAAAIHGMVQCRCYGQAASRAEVRFVGAGPAMYKYLAW
jgi:hypothetical protein